MIVVSDVRSDDVGHIGGLIPVSHEQRVGSMYAWLRLAVSIRLLVLVKLGGVLERRH